MSQGIILHRLSFSKLPQGYTLDTFDATQNGHSVVHIIVEKVNKFASLSADDYQVEL